MSAAPGPAPPALPPALAPWAALFADMPEPDLRILAALVEALRPLLGRVEGAGTRPEGEIDGLGGLGTRGGIERLVASEWLWRELDPDAFLQRAAARDLLTLEPVYRQAAEAGAVLVVLDAGPDLLGAPRLVAFAALLCLGALARRRGARLLWASTAAPERGWRAGLERADAALLLRESAATALDGPELDRILAEPIAARAGSRPGASLWLVGGAALPEAPRQANRIAIAERPRLGPDGLAVAAEVAVTGATAGAARARLDLPPEAEAVALLREPFRPRSAPGDAPGAAPNGSARPAPARSGAEAPSGWVPAGLAFAPGAEHLLVARPDCVLVIPAFGDCTALRLPIARHDRLAGLDVGPNRIRAAFVTVYADRARIVLRAWDLGGRALGTRLDLRVPRDHPLAAARFPGAALPPLGVLKRRDRCWLLASDGAPFLLGEDRVSDYSALRGAGPLAVAPAGLLMRDREDAVVARSRADGQVLARFPAQAAASAARARDVLFTRARYVLAAEGADGAWRLIQAWSEEGRQVGPHVRPHGRIAGFVCLDPRRHGAAAEYPVAFHHDAGAAALTLRDLDGAPVRDPLPLPDAALDLVHLAAHHRAGPCIAAARRDAEGYVEGLALCTLDGTDAGTWRHLPDLAAFADETPCLPA